MKPMQRSSMQCSVLTAEGDGSGGPLQVICHSGGGDAQLDTEIGKGCLFI
jgi:hypothetical protein